MKLEEYVATGFVEGGKLTVRNRTGFDQAMRRFREGEVVLVTIQRARATRSLDQNAWYWGCILKALAEHTGYTVDEMHEYCKTRFNAKTLTVVDDHGEVKDEQRIGQSTTKLNKLTFGEYCERIRQWAATELDVNILDPNPHWRESAA